MAKEQGCDEALLVTPHGRVLEGPTTALFYALDGEQLYTPPLDDHILDSITRRHVIAVTGAQERVTPTDDLSATRRRSWPRRCARCIRSRRIEQHELAAPGPLTRGRRRRRRRADPRAQRRR